MGLLLRLLSSSSRYRRNSDFPKAFRVFSYSTEASPPKETLYSRIQPLAKHSGISHVLDQWVNEGRGINHSEVLTTIIQLRCFRRSNQALEVSEWMSKHQALSSEDAAIQLDLISGVRGVKEAEEYFDGLPSSLINLKVYGALLYSYVRAKSTEKAEATMQKMKELGYTTHLSYNCMLKLYYETREYEKLEALAQEREEKGIVGNKDTLRHQLKAYAAKSDIEGIDKIVAKIRADTSISVDWVVYITATSEYLEARLKEKALEMLTMSEKLLSVKPNRYAYEFLMTSYAKLENKDRVYHIWNLCRKNGKVSNMTYLTILGLLYEFEDVEGMEKIYEEWDAKKTSFSIRVPNLLVGIYCKKGLMEKAESIVESLVESGNKGNSTTWDNMATGYYKYGQFEKAVEAMKKAILVSHPEWRPNSGTLAGCTEYLKGKGDDEFAKFRSLLDKHSHPPVDVSETLETCK